MVHTTEFQLVKLFSFSMLLIGLNQHVRVIYSTVILPVILHCFISDDKFCVISVTGVYHMTYMLRGRKQNKMAYMLLAESKTR